MTHILRSSVIYALRGLIIILPFLMILAFVRSVVDFLGEHFLEAPWYLLIVGAFLVLFPVGYIFSRHLGRIVMRLLERLAARHSTMRPLYVTMRHVVGKITLKERVFTDAVWVIDPESDQRNIGFLTQDTMRAFDLPGHVCVFLPSAFSLQGEMLVVPSEQIEPITKNREEAFALVMSAGLIAPEDVPDPIEGDDQAYRPG